MSIEKNKIVFFSVIAIVILFIVAYTSLYLTGEEGETENLVQPAVPALKEENKSYTSKIDALDDLKEVRHNDPPSIYSEKLLDSLGVYDPALEEKDRLRVIDSIYRYGSIDYEEETWREEYPEDEVFSEVSLMAEEPEADRLIDQDLSVGHRDFFKPGLVQRPYKPKNGSSDTLINAMVHGNQVVRANDRLELILTAEARINGRVYPTNTLIYGFVSLQANRVHIKITHIENRPVKMKAYDLQDSNEGIYVENRLRAEASREVLDDVIQDINVAGFPQIGGIKDIFRRSNRNLKVTVMDQYQLILKPEL